MSVKKAGWRVSLWSTEAMIRQQAQIHLFDLSRLHPAKIWSKPHLELVWNAIKSDFYKCASVPALWTLISDFKASFVSLTADAQRQSSAQLRAEPRREHQSVDAEINWGRGSLEGRDDGSIFLKHTEFLTPPSLQKLPMQIGGSGLHVDVQITRKTQTHSL